MNHRHLFVFLFLCACSPSESEPAIDAGEDVPISVDATSDLLDADPDLPEQMSRFDVPYEVTCIEPSDGFVRFSFDIGAETVRFQLVPFNPDGSFIRITQVDLPDGTSLNLNSENEFQVRTEGPITPINIPGTSQLISQLQAGTYTIRATTGAPEMCYYVVQKETTGDGFDVNFYFASSNFTAATAQTHVEFGIAVAEFERIFEAAGIDVRTIRYLDFDDSEGYRILEEKAECEAMFAESQRPGPTEDDALSLNIFIIDDITWSTVIGSVHGVNGGAGFHGTTQSGVVLADKYLGRTLPLQTGGTINGSVLMGVTMAHESAHFFGLRHTSERNQVVFDPLLDTPECSSGELTDCPDVSNLMFFGGIDTELTPQQVEMMRLHPVIK